MAVLLAPNLGQAQSQPWVRVGANGILLYTLADPVPRSRSLGEVRVVQPALMAHAGAFSNRLRMLATIDLEGLTIPDGELTPGAWGEGFIDRRHPHTYLHELVLSIDDLLGDIDGEGRLSFAAGKGFVPFGTDDPMVRPVVRYPVNHHLAQILERAVAVAGVRAGPVTLEAGLFNGDEPERPGQWPSVGRFGDSWSARLTVLPVAGLELQGSHAVVHSPEHRLGTGTDQHKWSLSGRWDGNVRGFPLYGLVEWAQTSEADGFFVFHSLLTEGAWTVGRNRFYSRLERTERPEEERTLNPFRTVVPPVENSILGTTRWTIYTAGYAFRMNNTPDFLGALPFLELSYGQVADVGGGLFDARAFYGRSSFWSISAGVRLSLGGGPHRMGRYGVAEGSGHHDH